MSRAEAAGGTVLLGVRKDLEGLVDAEEEFEPLALLNKEPDEPRNVALALAISIASLEVTHRFTPDKRFTQVKNVIWARSRLIASSKVLVNHLAPFFLANCAPDLPPYG